MRPERVLRFLLYVEPPFEALSPAPSYHLGVDVFVVIRECRRRQRPRTVDQAIGPPFTGLTIRMRDELGSVARVREELGRQRDRASPARLRAPCPTPGTPVVPVWCRALSVPSGTSRYVLSSGGSSMRGDCSTANPVTCRSSLRALRASYPFRADPTSRSTADSMGLPTRSLRTAGARARPPPDRLQACV
jgi:hypothetical protein